MLLSATTASQRTRSGDVGVVADRAYSISDLFGTLYTVEPPLELVTLTDAAVLDVPTTRIQFALLTTTLSSPEDCNATRACERRVRAASHRTVALGRRPNHRILV